jgi:hypothetical protein
MTFLMDCSGRAAKALATTVLACLSLLVISCGGSSSTTPGGSGALTGNWQVNLTQDYPLPVTQLNVSGFVVQSDNTLTGSVQVPTDGTLFHCGGVSPLEGTISGQTVAFSVNEGGALVNFTGTLGTDGSSMTGSYQAVGGACFPGTSTTGTFSTFLVPPLNGNFTGTLNSSYMELLTGATEMVPVTVSGTMSQTSNAGASNATLTGTITAVGYPCFSTATLSGTISGQNVYMNVFGYNGQQLGTLGQPPASAGGVGATPATVVVSSTGISLVGSGTAGLTLGVTTGIGQSGPCPPLANPAQSFPIVDDSADVTLAFD